MTIYTEWLEAKKELDLAKKRELELRNKICSSLLDTIGKADHTENNVTYTAKSVLRYTLDRDGFLEKQRQLSDEERACIRVKYEIDVKNYKALQEKKTLGRLVTVKPSQPQLTAKERNE